MQVSLKDVRVDLLFAQVAEAELAFAINGKVVGLVSSGGSADGPVSSRLHPRQEQQHLPICLGLGLVRAVDARRQMLYVLSDVPEEQLQQVDTLVVGKLELPDKLQATHQFVTPYQGLYCLSTTATGAGVIKSRNNLLRASLARAIC
jgi:polynucleotide 5'-hydroxyl-kinase GRC3/NOL9